MPSELPPVVPGVALLHRRRIGAGERWIYSAGFNVGPDLTDTTRIDTELPDLARLSDAGARVAILSHQGSHADGTAGSLQHVAAHLGGRLGRGVHYVPDNASTVAVDAAAALRDGDIALFGNTRAHAGEERNDDVLAAAFARLGDVVAVGGFSKAHRAHASNVGLLGLLPGFLTDSVLHEISALRPWAGRSDRYSVAALGGVKSEKTVIGLDRLTRTYDLVIPGGVVLNTLLRVLGHDVRRSHLGNDPERCAEIAAQVLDVRDGATIHVPDHVTVADADHPRAARRIALADGVPPGQAIVDFDLTPWARSQLARLARTGGRALIAGTPSRYTCGFGRAATTMLDAFSAPGIDAILLGGDTVAELPWTGPVSAGGGSALAYLADGTCAVLDALRRQRLDTPDTT